MSNVTPIDAVKRERGKPAASERKGNADRVVERFKAEAAGYFKDGRYGLPIIGTDPPLPCPFCGKTDVAIHLDDSGNDYYGHAECVYCGAETGSAGTDFGDEACQILTYWDVAKEAARLWNARVAPVGGLEAS